MIVTYVLGREREGFLPMYRAWSRELPHPA